MPTHRIVLPSGLEIRARARHGALDDDDQLDGERALFGRAVRALLAPDALELRDGATAGVLARAGTGRERGARTVGPGAGEPIGSRWIAMDREAVLALPMRDFHVLRDLLLRTGAIAAEPDDGECRNCDAPLAFDPRTLDPRDLETRHASAPFLPEGPVTLPSPLRLPRGGIASDATLSPVTLGDALPLLHALGRDEPFRITPRLLAAMGVRALGSLETPVLVARVLGRADDATWSAIEQRYLELNSAPPIREPLTCPRCGTLHEIEVPTPRELDPEAHAREGHEARDAGPFPSPEEFEALVERIAPGIYDARGIRNVALRVETGVPDTDLSGEPLLGSYQPRHDVDLAGHSTLEFLITLYYESFRRMWRDDGPYDLEAELRETIDHELEHHLYHLAGHDPMDAAERAEARRELRELYGDRRLARMAAREAAGDLVAFVRATWPFFTAIAIGLGIASLLGWIWL